MATWIKTDGTEKEVTPVNGRRKFGLAQLQEMVGGYIEMIPAQLNGKKLHMIINEDGNVKRLPPNAKASALARHDLVMIKDGVIRGNVVLITAGEM